MFLAFDTGHLLLGIALSTNLADLFYAKEMRKASGQGHQIFKYPIKNYHMHVTQTQGRLH